MFDLRRMATYAFITTLAALTLLMPMIMPGQYATSHIATAPTQIKSVFVLFAVLGLLIPRTLSRMVFARFEILIEQRHPAAHKLLRIQGLEVISARHLRQMLHLLSHSTQTAIAIALWGFFVARILALFPDSQPAARELHLMIVSSLTAIGQATIDYLPNAVQIAVILVLTRYGLKLVHLFFHAIEAGIIVLPDFYPEWAEPTYKIVRLLICIFIPLVIAPLLPGANSQFFDEITFFIGLLVSLGSTSVIKNMTAGIVLTYTRSLQIGDRVKIGDISGDVLEKSLFVTRIKTIKNEQVAVPNGTVLDSNIINANTLAAEHGLILHTSVTIGYDIDWRQVHNLLIEAALATPHILPDPPPFVFQTSLDDYYVAYEINAYTDQPNRTAATLSVLHQHILDEFHMAGVEIMSPSYSALRNGNSAAIPPEKPRHRIYRKPAAPLPVSYAPLPQKR